MINASIDAARKLAVVKQGLGEPRSGGKVGRKELLEAIRKIGLVQESRNSLASRTGT